MAGGRKTMSWFAGAAVSLAGRPIDELSHVLVTPEELEQCDDFWWPTNEDNWVQHRFIKDENGEPIRVNTRLKTDPADNSGAIVEMAGIPFVPLRPYLGADVFEGRGVGYKGVVDRANAVLAAQHLEIDVPNRKIRFGGCMAELQNKEMAYYSLVAIAKKGRWKGSRTSDGEFGWLSAAKIQSTYCEDYYNLYNSTHLGVGCRTDWVYDDEEKEKSVFQTILEDGTKLLADLRHLRADIKRTIEKSFQNRWLSDQILLKQKKRGSPLYGLTIPDYLIRISKGE
jgi:hypothetical protein